MFELRLIAAALMGWTLGANDTASVFGLAITTRMVRALYALILTAVFVIIGAVLQGQEGIATYGSLSSQTLHTAFIIALIPSLAIMVTATIGLPASTTQAVVGAMVGISVIQGDVDWAVFAKLGVGWAVAPIGTMIFALLLYLIVSRSLERWLKQLALYEAMLRIGFIVVGAYGAYSLGANNVANVVGVWVEAGALSVDQAVWFGAVAIALGSLTFSKRVIAGVGHRIVDLDPFSGFIATLSGALMLHTYAILGVPVSASQAIVGAVVGIGLVKGTQTVHTKSIVRIVIAWFVVPIFTMLLAMLAITLFPG